VAIVIVEKHAYIHAVLVWGADCAGEAVKRYRYFVKHASRSQLTVPCRIDQTAGLLSDVEPILARHIHDTLLLLLLDVVAHNKSSKGFKPAEHERSS
jgi:hypothetical protein